MPKVSRKSRIKFRPRIKLRKKVKKKVIPTAPKEITFLRFRINGHCKRCGNSVEVQRYLTTNAVECTICRFTYPIDDEAIFELIRTIPWGK